MGRSEDIREIRDNAPPSLGILMVAGLSPDKGKPAARRGRKTRGLSEVAQLPKETPMSIPLAVPYPQGWRTCPADLAFCVLSLSAHWSSCPLGSIHRATRQRSSLSPGVDVHVREIGAPENAALNT
jgi:hypothetical protein